MILFRGKKAGKAWRVTAHTVQVYAMEYSSSVIGSDHPFI